MSTIEKLAIRGIRSFDHQQPSEISFGKPLTIIVGQNGAGKTTIIECLKMATTGSLPPNSRSGQNFINDPKVANEVEVKAQIKLRFKTNQGSRVVAIRSFQLTQKKVKVEYKTLDGTIQTIDHITKEKTAVNYRCIDMDRTVPMLMGVSKAILENVIFVHQEESSWPLDEGSVLKKKFDDIFSATKYTKALEALLKLKKEQNQAVREMKLKMETLQSHMDQALRYRHLISAGEHKAAKLQEDMDSLKAEMEVIEAEKAGVDDKLSHIADLGEDIGAASSKLEMKRQQNARLLEELGSEPQATVEEMERRIVQMQASLDEVGKLKEQMQGPLDQCLADIERSKKQHRQEVERHSMLKAEAEMHESNIAERNTLICGLAQKTGMASVPDDGQLDSQAVAVFSDHIRHTAEKLASELSHMKEKNRSADNAISENLAKTEAQIDSAAETLSSKQDLREQREAQLAQRERQAGQIHMSDELLEQLAEEEERSRQELIKAQKRLEEDEFEAKLANADQRLAEMGRAVSILREERKHVEAASESSTRLRIKKKEMLEAKQKAEGLMHSNKRSLLKFMSLNQLPDMQSLKGILTDTVSRKQREAEQKGVERKTAEAKVNSTKAKHDAAHQQVQQVRNKASDLRKQVLDDLDVPSRTKLDDKSATMEGLLAERSHEREFSENKLAQCLALQKIIGDIIGEARESSCCATCQRRFEDKNALTGFIDNQELIAQALPEKIANWQSKLDGVKQSMQTLSRLHPIWLQYESINKEIPELESRAGLLFSELKSCQQSADMLAEEHDKLQAVVKSGTDMLHSVGANIENLHQRCSGLQKEISDLERRMAGSQTSRNVADVDADLENVERDRDRVRAERDDLSSKQTMAARNINTLNTKLHVARGELQEAHNKRKEKEKLKAEAEELELELATLMEEINGLERNQAPLRNSLRALVSERAELRKAASQKEQALEEELQTFRGMADNLMRLEDPIHKYITAGKAGQMEASETKVVELEEQISSLEVRAKEAEAQVRSQGDEVLRREAAMRHLRDEMQYLRSRAEEEHFHREIMSLQERMSQIGDQQVLIGKVERMKRALGDLQDQRSMKKGSIETEREGIANAQLHLREPQYQDIDAKCRSQQIKQKTTEMATRDLDKYHKALEKALQSYHATKMADINKLIKELWQKTYRNQDIDFIMIKSDADGQRSYNYRVVMVCQDAELDMRGRCSAGQKVLACLIIRLALAETFCLNCGILTLDEPTTNLDAANSASLAEALRRLMKDRENQDNFQMVVITHDERFAAMIGTREHVDHIWRVTKDERQHSHLSTEPVEA